MPAKYWIAGIGPNSGVPDWERGSRFHLMARIFLMPVRLMKVCQKGNPERRRPRGIQLLLRLEVYFSCDMVA